MTRVWFLVLTVVFLVGCTTEDVVRYDGVTLSAGDAIAANSAMQMVDPWPRGVENTRLRVPAARHAPQAARPETSAGEVRK